jgi:RNA polymerase sigma-70 factor (ECF subfamily)
MAAADPGAATDLPDLLARVAMRDQAAFRQLYDRTARTLLAIVVRLLRDQGRAEEVVQEIYVSIWHSAPSYSAAKSQPMTWLMTIARYKAMDALRASTAERENVIRPIHVDDDEEGGLPEVADQSAGPLDLLIRGVEAVRLRGCLEGLEPSQRQAIALAFYDGMTHAELSAHLRQPLGTVKAWVRRGLERLRRCLRSETT